ncbi:uncharacterized protein Z520_00301 [Fonsecaea multimorphosa CBS 102226]|uniref:Uncharacterized protein n=1 Tax=Fonsecaea multimorphosa CBS 102226 TaxID=1442371 RepID=A0A0D2KJD5_9EURO|nr:uncharacterized protein Z520_00301 [Fonsecaea multimorphosa CBS 102226]KIY03610.1 hypothetical protein Z520_00301 [Fonsecaea multimorphosa CBS 102226]
MTGDSDKRDTEQETLQTTPSSTKFTIPKCRESTLDFCDDSVEWAVTTDDASSAQNNGGSPQGSTSSAPSFSTTSTRRCNLGPECILQPPRDLEPAIRTDIAFGDGQGTVGYISEFGELIQVSRMLDFGPHGVIQVRPNSDIADFDHIIQGSCSGIGLRLNNRSAVPEEDFRPVSYIHDRWPKLSYTTGGVEVEMVFAVVDKKIVHQCVLSNKGNDDATVDLVFDLGFALDAPHDFGFRSATKFKGGTLTSGNTCIVLCGNPGGYASFGASLYIDHGHRVPLVPVTSKDPPGTSGEPKLGPSHDGGKEAKEKELSRALFHLLPIEIASGDDFYKWQRRKDDSFWTAYDEAKSKEDSARASKILEDGVSQDAAAPAQTDAHDVPSDPVETTTPKPPNEEQSPVQKGESLLKSQVPFQNLGGEGLFSHRLFGIEWKSRWSWHDILDDDTFWDVMYGPRRMKYKEEMQELVTAEFKKLRANPKIRPSCGYINLHENLSSHCPGKWIKGLPDQPTEFLFRRYLQHILSVVPIGIPWKRDGDCAYFFCTGGLHDVSMRPAAALYQFRFLGCMHRLLMSQEGIIDDSLKSSLTSDIEKLCKGHLEWCFEVAQKTKSGLWASVYKAPGAQTTTQDDHLHSAINFLKLLDFYVEFPKSRPFVLDTLNRRLLPWLKALQETRNKNSGLWESARETIQVSWWDPNYRQDEEVSIPNYDLCDSVQHWQTLQTLFNIINEVKDNAVPRSDADSAAVSTSLQHMAKELLDSLESTGLMTDLDPSAFREKILERFSFEIERSSVETSVQSVEFSNEAPVSGSLVEEMKANKKRLLAIKRCAKERPRWNWYAEAMILCPKFDLGFFDHDRPSKRLDEWSKAVEAQQFQLEQFWRKPLRYLLALILALDCNISLDRSKDPATMASTCRMILLGCVLGNGLMAEEVDPKNKKPQSRLRNFPTAVFGVPYYLFRVTYGDLLGVFPKQISNSPGNTRVGITVNEKLWKKSYKAIRSRTKAGLYNLANVDRANVVDLTETCEPEWLFDDPWYFTQEDPLADRAEGERGPSKYIKETVQSGLKLLKDFDRDEGSSPYAVFNDSIQLHSRNNDNFWADADEERPGSVVDVIRTGKRQSQILEEIPNAWELLDHIWKKRTKNDVKKRLIYVYNCGPRFSLSLYLSVPERERYSMATFLARHQTRDVFHREDTHKTINSWITELHLGFYRVISDLSAPAAEDDSDEEQVPPSRTIFSGKPFRLPGDETKLIEKCAIGFRFDGDLYDRYWTCFVAVYLPQCGHEDRWFADVDSFKLTRPTGEGNKDTEHSQRKILEARWFERATRIICEETRRILRVISHILGEDQQRNGRYTATSYDTFRETFESNKTTYSRYGEMVNFLRHVLENLEAVRNVADKWETRETAREVQPRWTRDDEAAYAHEISIWRRRAQANVRNMAHLEKQIEAKLDHIKQLREWLLDDLQLKEARVSNRSADDVRIFTYATVVFLPLSFASSIFSMGGAPSHSTAVSFVTAAVIALVATIAFVLNAGTFMRAIAQWKIWVFDLPDEAGFTEHSESQWRRVGQKFTDWFVRYPAARVLDAWKVVRMKDHKAIVGKLLLGILMSPLFAFTWIFGFLTLNLYDLVMLLFLDLPRYPGRRRKHQTQLKTTESVVQLADTQKATRDKEKKGGKSSAEASNEKEARRRGAEKAREKWRQERLKHFMHKPRIVDISKHLSEGKTIQEIQKAHRQDLEKRKTELQERRQKYRHAIESVSDFSGSEDEDEKPRKPHERRRALARMFGRRRQESDVEARNDQTELVQENGASEKVI